MATAPRTKPAAGHSRQMLQPQLLAMLLKLLGQEHRLMIVTLLRERERTVTDIVEGLRYHWPNVSQPAVSHHLTLMVAAGFLTCERRNRYTHYRFLEERWTQMLELLDQFGPAAA